MKIKTLFIVFVLLIAATTIKSQTVIVKNKHPHKKTVVVKNKPGRGHRKKTIVYHPVWGPKVVHYRRWVYFPKYNIYWDNRAQVYVYQNGTVWVRKTALPATLVKIDLSKEKSYELKEEDDDTESIESKNSNHSQEYKPD